MSGTRSPGGLRARAAGAVDHVQADWYAWRRGPFQVTRRVWSRGLALACDHNGGVPFVRMQGGSAAPRRFPPGAFDAVRAGDLVWMRAIALPQFVEEALPRIEVPFALVTGDEDWRIPSSFARSDALLEDPRLLCWFAQNVDGTARSPKLHPLPIGLDFHTISNHPAWGHARATPAEQEAELDAIVAVAPPNEDRLVLAHADFHIHPHGNPAAREHRDAVERALRGNPAVAFQERKVPRSDLWREKTRYAFVVSPHGNGLDCHRTWESLALGNIVIVERSSLDPLYEGLPVVVVDDWREITAGNLTRWHAQHAPAFRRPEVAERLTNRWWIDKVRRTAAASSSSTFTAETPTGTRARTVEVLDATPRVSVLMPVYDGAAFVGEAVRSILDQSFRDLELLVVDDGSTDGTLAILDAVAARDPRLRVLSGAHAGTVAALNRGLAAVRGSLVARLDADDVALPGRLAAQVRFLDDHPECVAVGGAVRTIDRFGIPQRTFRLPREHDEIVAMLLAGNGLAQVHPAVMIRREALTALGGYRPAFAKIEDFDLTLRLAEIGRLANLPDLVLLYRQHAGNTARKHHAVMSRLKVEAVRESYARRDRELPIPFDVPPERRLEPSAQSLLWALFAVVQGHPAAGASHTVDALRALPRTPSGLVRLARSVADYRQRIKT